MAPRQIPLSAPHITEEEKRLVSQVLDSGRLASGPMLTEFENAFAERFGARFAVGVSSGTSGLHLTMIAAGIQPGDLVITSPFSFVASSNSILYEGGIPVFVDVDDEPLTMNVARTLEAIDTLLHRRRGWEKLLPPNVAPADQQLRVILPVHIFGRCMPMREIMGAADAAGLTVIEDACEAIGATDGGVPAGRFGRAGVFGFYPNKQMTTGEGGMIITDDASWAALFRSLANQGRSDDGNWLNHERLGFNYRLDDMSAALGLAQIRRFDELLRRRESVANAYARALASVEGVRPLAPADEGNTLSWFVYPIRLDEHLDRNELMARLARRGVDSRPYFPPIHLQPYYRRRFGYTEGMFPAAEAAGRSLLALPFHSALADDDIEFIVESIAEELATIGTRRAVGAR